MTVLTTVQVGEDGAVALAELFKVPESATEYAVLSSCAAFVP